MSDDNHQGLLRRPYLTDDQRVEIATLAAICNARDGLDLKLSIGMPHPEADQAAGDFLFYDDRRLVGYCALDSSNGPPFELCGMVHPDYRRRGIGRALLGAAVAETTQRGVARLLLICEDASTAGLGFVTAAGAVYVFSEHRLTLDRAAFDQRQQVATRLMLQPVGPPAMEELVHTVAAAFGDTEEDVRAGIARSMAHPSERYYLARLDGTPVGSIRVVIEGNDAALYGFGVVPAYRRRGFGREILCSTVEALLAANHGRIGLEVETDNRKALGLYQSCGFREATTYGYYQLRGRSSTTWPD